MNEAMRSTIREERKEDRSVRTSQFFRRGVQGAGSLPLVSEGALGVLGQAPNRSPPLAGGRTSEDFQQHFSEVRRKGLERRLTVLAVACVTGGTLLILLIQIVLSSVSVPGWTRETLAQMIQQERDSVFRLADLNAAFLTEIFGRINDNVLQVQAFAKEVLSNTSTKMVVSGYPQQHSGSEQSVESWEHSVWHTADLNSDSATADVDVNELLKRSALMDVLFRGMSWQNNLTYVAVEQNALANMQTYPAQDVNQTNYNSWGDQECDPRFSGYEGGKPEVYDPRCRPWYQDGVAAKGDVVFTEPYAFHTLPPRWSITTCAAVMNATETLLGVAAVDMRLDVIEKSIGNLKAVSDEGYAYVLSPNTEDITEGVAFLHPHLERDSSATDDQEYLADKSIFNLENYNEEEEEEFKGVLANMGRQCTGNATNSHDGDTWILSWAHENASASSCLEGYIVVVTISESALRKVFSKTEREILQVLLMASVIMAAVVVVILSMACYCVRVASARITRPVSQLVDIVRALNRLDYSKQAVGTPIVNDQRSPEEAELMQAFQEMVTIVEFANTTLGAGNLTAACHRYEAASMLFKKLGNGRGVNIVRNNLGNVHTLQARELVKEAYQQSRTFTGGRVLVPSRKESFLTKADEEFEIAKMLYTQSIDDAQARFNGVQQHNSQQPPERIARSAAPPNSGSASRSSGGAAIAEYSSGNSTSNQASNVMELGGTLPPTDAAAPDRFSSVDNSSGQKHANVLRPSFGGSYGRGDRGSRAIGSIGGREESSAKDLMLQLVTRKFNLAVCLVEKGRTGRDDKATDEARQLLAECKARIDTRDSLGVERRAECLLTLAALERSVGRLQEAAEALEEAEAEIKAYPLTDEGLNGLGLSGNQGAVPLQQRQALPVRLAVLRQSLLAEHGAQSLAKEEPEQAIDHWNNAVVNCGKRMNRAAVRSSLEGLRLQAELGRGHLFSTRLHQALGTAPSSFAAGDNGERKEESNAVLAAAIDAALDKLSLTSPPSEVDLCFIMDCTRSMQTWISQAKEHMMDIIDQTRRDEPNLHLRVAFVGYRDFGDRPRYEGPYDFHSEEDLPDLLEKLKNVVEGGGDDIPEDMAGGLKFAAEMSWRSPTRLCILIADAPCHGRKFHDSYEDNYPLGDPNGLDPIELLYILQYELGVDFYFIQISSITDDMIKMFRAGVKRMATDRQGSEEREGSRSDAIGGRRAGWFASLFRRGTPGHAEVQPASKNHTNKNPKFVEHRLGDKHDRFLPAVVNSVRVSLGITTAGLYVDSYA